MKMKDVFLGFGFVCLILILFACNSSKDQPFTCADLKQIAFPDACKSTFRKFTYYDSLIADNAVLWQTISPAAIDYFITLEGQKDLHNFFSCDNDTFCLGKDWVFVAYFGQRMFVTREIAALHYINAIYYGSYFFASDRVLYDTTLAVYDAHLMCKMPLNYQNMFGPAPIDSSTIAQAWAMVKKWRNDTRGLPIEEIRKGQRPFEGSSLFFVGEKGGNINPTFEYKGKKHYPREVDSVFFYLGR